MNQTMQERMKEKQKYYMTTHDKKNNLGDEPRWPGSNEVIPRNMNPILSLGCNL